VSCAKGVEPATDPVDVAHRLDVGRHERGVRVVRRPAEQVAEPEHGLVAHAEDDPKADGPIGGELVHRPGDRPGLADHGDAARDRLGRRRGAVRRHPVDVVHEPLDVGAEDGQAVAQGRLAEPLLQRATLGSGLGEAARDHHDAADARVGAVVDESNDDPRRDDEHEEVDARLRQVGNGG
jgi:hypothetical protein